MPMRPAALAQALQPHDRTDTQSDFRFFHRLRVRWAEVDMQKIVFNAHYLMYFDTAIADYWRALALPYEEAMHAARGRPVRAQGDGRIQRLGAHGRPCWTSA